MYHHFIMFFPQTVQKYNKGVCYDYDQSVDDTMLVVYDMFAINIVYVPAYGIQNVFVLFLRPKSILLLCDEFIVGKNFELGRNTV